MNIFQKVTLKTLLKNKTRTLVTIIGIILSASMITAVTTLITSLQKYMLEVAVHESGDWHGAFSTVSPEKVDEYRNEYTTITQVACIQNIGYAYLENSMNTHKPYLFIGGAEESFMQSMPIHLLSGRLPENASEIILPEHLAANGGVIHRLGDLLQLSIAERMSEGKSLRQYHPFRSDEEGVNETLTQREERSYTVVGFYKRPAFEPFTAPGYTAMTVSDGERTGYTFDVYFKLKEPKSIYDFLSSESQREGYKNFFDNRNVLLFSGVSRYSNFYGVLYTLGGILILLIMFGSVSLIYNAFSISVSERTKQFGLFSSVGATKKQIKKSVLFEAVVVSLAGIPLGILAGLVGIGITLGFVGDKFSYLYRGDMQINLTLHANIWAVLSAALVALVTVLISAWVPSKRAMRVTAIEAVRQAKEIDTKGKAVRVSKLTYRLFGLEGMLARKHFKRSRRKYRATVVSLFMSIVLFISASAFCSHLKSSVDNVFETRNYDIGYSTVASKLGDVPATKLYDALKDVPGVIGSNYSYYQGGRLDIPKAYLTPEHIQFSEDRLTHASFYAIDDAIYRRFLEEQGIEPAIFMNADAPLGIALSVRKRFNYETERFEVHQIFRNNNPRFLFEVFDTEKYNELTREQKSELDNLNDFYITIPIQVGAVVDRLPMGIDGAWKGDDVTLMYPQSLMNIVLQQHPPDALEYFFTVKNHSAAFKEMTSVIVGHGLASDALYNYAEMVEISRNVIIIINVFSYGFIILISLIAAANVFNTISTNIILRKREFAMLKSVGMP